MIGSYVGAPIGSNEPLTLEESAAEGVVNCSSTVTGVAEAAMAADATSSGTSAVSGVVVIVAETIGTIAGTATISANGVALHDVSGAIAGVASGVGAAASSHARQGFAAGTSIVTGVSDFENQLIISTSVLHHPINCVMAGEAGHGPRRGMPAELMRHIFNE